MIKFNLENPMETRFKFCPNRPNLCCLQCFIAYCLRKQVQRDKFYSYPRRHANSISRKRCEVCLSASPGLPAVQFPNINDMTCRYQYATHLASNLSFHTSSSLYIQQQCSEAAWRAMYDVYS